MRVPFDSEQWDWNGVAHQADVHLGRPCVRLDPGEAGGPIVTVRDVELEDEFEVELAVGAGRSFPGVVWRAYDADNCESLFVRPHQVGNPDAIQYTPVSNGISSWQLYHGEGFWNTISFPIGGWFPNPSSSWPCRKLRRLGRAGALRGSLRGYGSISLNRKERRDARRGVLLRGTRARLMPAKPGAAVSHICQAYPDRVEVRGRDLTRELMGSVTFTEYFHLLLTGSQPTEDQRYFLDLLLVSIAEHGMMPTNVAARMTLAADPGSLQGALAAGILGGGPVILGTAEPCAQVLEEMQARVVAGAGPEVVAAETAQAIHAAGEKAPGFGHPVHRPVDPRAERILELADARGVSGAHVLLARIFHDAVAEAWGRPLTMNVSLPIAAVLLDLGFATSMVKSIPLLARTAGLLAHLAEEQQLPSGFVLAKGAEAAVEYAPGDA